MKTASPSKDSEAQAQRKLVAWAKQREWWCPDLRWLYHVPNSGHRRGREASMFTKAGVSPGVPDLCLPVPAWPNHGLYIEMKAESGRLSKDQEIWVDGLRANAYEVQVCYSFQEAAWVLFKHCQEVQMAKRNRNAARQRLSKAKTDLKAKYGIGEFRIVKTPKEDDSVLEGQEVKLYLLPEFLSTRAYETGTLLRMPAGQLVSVCYRPLEQGEEGLFMWLDQNGGAGLIEQ